MKWQCVLWGAFLIIVTGCSSVSVSRDYDESTDFSVFRTFAWQHAEQPKTGNPRIDNDLIDERVREAVDSTLLAKGFNRADPENADFLVAYYMEYKQRIGGSRFSFGVGRGSYGRYGAVGYDTPITDYDEGHLTIDIIVPESGKSIWRGVGRRTMHDGASPKKTTKAVNSAVSKILAKFPPKQ